MLPPVKSVRDLPFFTPQKWQTVLFRNYGMVAPQVLARVLRTEEETVRREAARLGIDGIAYQPAWKKQGYISLIRKNWYLLPYEQLLDLLEMDEATLDYDLREDDFLGIKLGEYKPACGPVWYQPLTAEEIAETERLAARIREAFIPGYATPFVFYTAGEEAPLPAAHRTPPTFEKIVYSYSMMYGDTFLEEGEIVSDHMLAMLQAQGVNGIWMQGLLSHLSPYPFVAGMDAGYQTRRKNLNRLIAQCRRYGIAVYLYLNEPRGISPEQLTPQTEALKGRYFEGRWSLCTATREVQEYLFAAVRDLLVAVPDLGGIITITMSENMTNCHSRPNNPCPHCGHLSHVDVVPEVNNIFQRAIDAAGVKTRLLANLWSWTEPYGWTPELLDAGIQRMDQKIDILCVSEMGHLMEEGKRVQIKEYSLGHIGPCEETRANYASARAHGHRILAKVQVNSSWEIATVPYVPVFELVAEHMKNLRQEGVQGLMLSWTVGGYPTPAFDLVDRIFSGEDDLGAFYAAHFGERAAVVADAVHHFSDGFRHFPHTIGTVYQGAQELGPANLLYPEATGLHATMVAFAFDDYHAWCGTYSEEEWATRLEALLKEWSTGLSLLPEGGNAAYAMLRRYAEVVYVSLRSMLVQMRFCQARDAHDRRAALAWLEEEEALVRWLYRLASQDARVGYEASNHYYYTQNDFLEKLLDLDYVKRVFQQKDK